MPKVYICAESMLARTIELLSSGIDLSRVVAPRPIIFPSSVKAVKKTARNKRLKKKLAREAAYRRKMGQKDSPVKGMDAVFAPMALFGPIQRPEFVIDESELPY